MIAVINATTESAQLHSLNDELPTPLIPLCDRPFLQHILEHLLESGIRDFEIILNHLPYVVESYFGDGTRWGCHIRYHLAGPSLDAKTRIEQIVVSAEESILLGTSDFLPYLGRQCVMEAASTSKATIFVGHLQEPTGWMFVPKGIPNIQALLSSSDTISTHQVQILPELSIRTGEGLLRSQQKILDGSFNGIHLTGKQLQPGVWMARGAYVAPTVQVHPPVYLGSNCRVEAGAQIGPSAVIGSNSIVSAHSAVVHSMICPGTFIGEGLELDHVIVNQHHLIDLQVGTALSAPEPFFFSSLTDHELGLRLRSILDRVIAGLLLCLLGPLATIATIFRCLVSRVRVARDTFVLFRQTQAQSRDRLAHSFRIEWDRCRPRTKLGRLLFEFTPGLLTVVTGRLALVGMKARADAAIENLPDDWRALYLQTKPGLITEADVVYGSDHTEDELFAAEAYYGAVETVNHDLVLLGRYLFQFNARMREKPLTNVVH